MSKSKISPTLLRAKEERVLAVVRRVNGRGGKLFLDGKAEIVKEFPFISSVAVYGKTEDVIALGARSDVLSISEVEECHSFCSIAKANMGVERLNNLGLTGEGTVVAVLDSGIEPCLDIVGGRNRIIAFYDVVNKRSEPYDDNGHGTMIAGVIGGNGLSSGGKFAGLARDCSFVGVKCMNFEGVGNSINILDGMQWVYDNGRRLGVSVVCMAFGSRYLGEYDPLVLGAEALSKAGFCVCAASGNDGDSGVKSPGVSPRAITVGAYDDKRNLERDDDELADFSGRGGVVGKPDFLFPGVNICSITREGGYSTYSGTSVACAMCAGTALLIKCAHKRADGRAIKAIMNANSYAKGQNKYVYF